MTPDFNTLAGEGAVTMAALLNGVLVLDFGRYLAGLYCATLLAEYGAEVIQVEKCGGSEDRFPAQVGRGVGALNLQMNCNKRSITLGPATPAGREVVVRRVRSANMPVATLPRWWRWGWAATGCAPLASFDAGRARHTGPGSFASDSSRSSQAPVVCHTAPAPAG